MKYFAVSVTFIQPDTSPFRIVVHPHNDGFVCHREYQDTGYVDGRYGGLDECLEVFTLRIRDAYEDTLRCGGCTSDAWEGSRPS